jgi:hypothetical protein
MSGTFTPSRTRLAPRLDEGNDSTGGEVGGSTMDLGVVPRDGYGLGGPDMVVGGKRSWMTTSWERPW